MQVLSNNISKLEINSNNQNELNILYDFIRAKLMRDGIKLSSSDEYDEKLSLFFTDAKVEYKDLFKEHLFGSYLMTREITLAGNFILERKNEVFNFNITSSDTVGYDNYTDLENKIYTITEGIPPKEPFISSIIEPVIAVAATATAVILFFTIRSK